ncbi:thioredoxin-2-like [Miscanthus floridulus]|uniref:thioredoxin-2-like n=1 Tax=Miscanthus floridulus TaxID=154761 RepID=UPI003459242B
MSSSVTAVRDRSDLKQVMAKANEKLLVLEFMGSVSYRSTCEYMKPILDGIAAKKDAYFYTIDVNNDQFKEIAKEARLLALPTFLIVKGTKTVRFLVAPDEAELSSSIEDALEGKIN